jgi:MFS family permease
MSTDVRSIDAPSSARRVYYGWWIVIVAAAAMVGTLPGRTQGLGLVTEPLLADLGLSRVSYAAVNFWATIIGSLFAIGIGRFIDLFGSRVVLTLIALALGIVVSLMSGTTAIPALTVWLTLTRGLGQSALSVVSIAMVGHWFVRRIDMAMAVYSVVLSVGFMMAFPLVGSLVQEYGWRAAWQAIGVSLMVGLAPLAWLVVRRSPESAGLEPDGGTPQVQQIDGAEPVALQDDSRAEQPASVQPAIPMEPRATLRQAVATGSFWVFSLGAALYGLVASGIGLFNESILAERGFGADVYYQTLVVTAMTALAGNFGGGWLAGRVPLRTLLAASLFVLAAGLAWLPHVATMTQVMMWATAMGLGGGIMTVLFFSAWPRLFGRMHLGQIQGAAQALTVLASALGPLLLAWCVEWSGSYSAMFRVLASVIAGLGATAIAVGEPAAAAHG